jgi:hypothetical protein
LDHGPNGRIERRLPIIVVLRLALEVSAATDGERTFTDNVSAHGARIFSNHAWQAGDRVRVTPLNEDSVWAQVVYSEGLPNNRCAIGVKFQDGPVTWSVMRRYDGL